MRIAICDDDQNFAYLIRSYIKQTPVYERVWKIDVFTDCEQLLFRYEGDLTPFDLIFLDVKMPGVNGIDAGIAVRNRDPSAVIIFVTGYAEYALPAYQANPYFFMVKPVDPAQFAETLAKACQTIVGRRKRCLFIRRRSEYTIVSTDRILYIESYGHNLMIHLNGGKQLEYYSTLKKIEADISPAHFYRIHKSYIVNLFFVDRVDCVQKQLRLTDGTVLSISRHRMTGFQEKLYEVYKNADVL